MPHSLQMDPAGIPGPKPSPALGRDTMRRVLVHRHDSSPLAPRGVAGAMLLITTDATIAQGVGIPAAIATEGAGSLGLGALVGAVVAGAFALRERFWRD
jgi:hypothetical protein